MLNKIEISYNLVYKVCLLTFQVFIKSIIYLEVEMIMKKIELNKNDINVNFKDQLNKILKIIL